MAFLLGLLQRAGVREVQGVTPAEGVGKCLRRLRPGETKTFNSFFAAESILAFGSFSTANPVLAGMTDEELSSLARVVDTTSIYDPATQSVGGYPGNYWAVLARAELARERLGLLRDGTILEVCIGKLNALLKASTLGYFDDSTGGLGRYDIYSPDVMLFLEPLWRRLEPEAVGRLQRVHVELVERLAHENGASVLWGRSIGALSVCLTMEVMAQGLRLGLVADRERATALIGHAFERLKTWFEDDLISAHRYRMTYAYRGLPRLIQMTADCLAKAVASALALKEAEEKGWDWSELPRRRLFPECDRWIAFETGRCAGVWVYRRGVWSVQLPAVWGRDAEYAETPRQPGVLETPVDCDMLVGVPRVLTGEADYAPSGLPVAVEKEAGGVTLRYEGFVGKRLEAKSGGEQEISCGGNRRVCYRFTASSMEVEENWSMAGLEGVEAVTYDVAESGRPLTIEVKEGSEPSPFYSVVGVKGMQAWRGYWGEQSRLHQYSFPVVDAMERKGVRFRYTVRPALKVATSPGGHDYVRALMEAFPERTVMEHRTAHGLSPGRESVEGLTGKWAEDAQDVFHLHWPEHLFSQGAGVSAEEVDSAHRALVERLRARGVRVVWTLHNRRPHNRAVWPDERADRLYRLWAGAAAGVIHHSEWGRKVMQADLPWREDARHATVAHGHFGEQMKTKAARAELERKYGLKPEIVRVGLLGRWQAEKQVEMILSAFEEAAPEGFELVVTAYDERTPQPKGGGAGRVVFLPRGNWLARAEIAEHAALCDVLISAHTGERYLTSGVQADAIGVGATMLVPDWAFFREALGDAVFFHGNTPASLREAISKLTPEKVAAAKRKVLALQPRYEWSASARATLDLYREVMELEP